MRDARGANRVSTTGWMCLCVLTCLCLVGCEGRLVIPDTSLPWNEALAKLFGRTVETISLDRKEALLLAHVDEGLKNPLSEPYFITGLSDVRSGPSRTSCSSGAGSRTGSTPSRCSPFA